MTGGARSMPEERKYIHTKRWSLNLTRKKTVCRFDRQILKWV